MKANITKLGWTMTLDGKDYQASVTLTDDSVSDAVIQKALELLNDQLKRTICDQTGHDYPDESHIPAKYRLNKCLFCNRLEVLETANG